MKSLPALPVSNQLVLSQSGRAPGPCWRTNRGYWCRAPSCNWSCATNMRPKTNCSPACLPLGTCSTRGSSCSVAPPLVQTTCFECSRRVRRRLSRTAPFAVCGLGVHSAARAVGQLPSLTSVRRGRGAYRPSNVHIHRGATRVGHVRQPKLANRKQCTWIVGVGYIQIAYIVIAYHKLANG